MARSDWNFWNEGSPQINNAYSHSPSWSLRNVAGWMRMYYNGTSNLYNAAVGAWVKLVTPPPPGFLGHDPFELYARMDMLAPPNKPGNKYFNNGYWCAIELKSSVLNTVVITIGYSKNTVWNRYVYQYQVTNVVGAVDNWIKVRFSVRDEFNIPVIRLEQWTGSEWRMWYEYQDDSATKILTPGWYGFGYPSTADVRSIYYDDITISKFA